MTRKIKESDNQQKPFDPWTATPEEREAVAIQAAEWVKKAQPGATLPADSNHAKLLIWLKLKQIEECYTSKPEELPGWLILTQLASCFKAKISPPVWLIDAFCDRESAISSGTVKKMARPPRVRPIPETRQTAPRQA